VTDLTYGLTIRLWRFFFSPLLDVAGDAGNNRRS